MPFGFGKQGEPVSRGRMPRWVCSLSAGLYWGLPWRNIYGSGVSRTTRGVSAHGKGGEMSEVAIDLAQGADPVVVPLAVNGLKKGPSSYLQKKLAAACDQLQVAAENVEACKIEIETAIVLQFARDIKAIMERIMSRRCGFAYGTYEEDDIVALIVVYLAIRNYLPDS